MYFNKNAYLSTPYNYLLDIFDGSSPFTFETWFKLEKSSDLDSGTVRNAVLCIHGQVSSITYNFSVIISSPRTNQPTGSSIGISMNDALGGTSLQTKTDLANISKGIWHFLAITREHALGPIKLYLDGINLQLTCTKELKQLYVNASNDFRIRRIISIKLQ